MSKAIVFDLDNTLTHREKSIEAFSDYFFQYFKSALSTPDQNRIQKIIKETDNGGYGRAENPHAKLKKSIAIRLHNELDWLNKPNEQKILECWMTHFPRCSIAMPTALDTLQELKEKGFPMAVVSNGAQVSRLATIESLKLKPYFNCVVSSGAFGAKKPDVSIYHYAAERLGYLPEQCLFVGDHPMLDVTGAEQAGLQAAWLAGFHEWPISLPKPKRTLTCLKDILSFL